MNKLYYILFPFFLFAVAYITDKQFFIGDFPDYFLRSVSYLNYEHKDELLFELKDYLNKPNRRKVMVIFGNSRTMSFDNHYIQTKYPDWVLFNFSVPGGTTDWYYRYIAQFEKHNIKPDFIFFAVTPQGFNATPAVAMDEVMVNGLDVEFIFNHIRWYSVDDVGNVVAKKLFWTYQYRPKISLIIDRIKNHSEDANRLHRFKAETYLDLLRNRGSVPYGLDYEPVQNPIKLKDYALNGWKDYFMPYKLSDGQVYFTNQSLEVTHRMGIPTALLWVKVGSELRKLKASTPIGTHEGKPYTVKELWVPIMESLAQKNSSEFIDMNYHKSITCDLYYDSSHLAGFCFREFTDFLMVHATKINKAN